MSSNPNPSHNPTHHAGEGLYDSTGVEQARPLTEPLGAQVAHETRRSLQTIRRSSGSILDYVRRNPVPIVAAIGGLILMRAWRGRRSNR